MKKIFLYALMFLGVFLIITAALYSIEQLDYPTYSVEDQ